MDCDETQEHVHLLLDGALGIFRRRSVVRHLGGCSHCAEEVAFEYEFRQLVARKCTEQAPDHLRQKIIESIGLQRASFAGPSAGEVFGSMQQEFTPSDPEE